MAQNVKGSAAIAVAPSHGSTSPQKDTEMNEKINSIDISRNPVLSRRKALGLLTAAALPSVGVVAVASAQPTAKPFDLQNWLDTAEPGLVAEYHATRLAQVMGAIDPARSWRSHIDHQHGFALVCGDSRKEGEQ